MKNNPFKKGDLATPSKPHVSVMLEVGKIYTILEVRDYLVTIYIDRVGKSKYHYSWLEHAPKNAYLKHYFNG